MVAVFKKAFRDARGIALWTSIGFGVFAILVISFYPSLVQESESLNDMMSTLPEGMLSMIYGQADTDTIDIVEPGGYIHSQHSSWMVLIMGAILIGNIFNQFTNAERDNRMDVMLSLPVSRRSLIIGRALNTASVTLIMLTATWL
ncbi:MAG: ABC transporter permease subunit, partial [Anaerolineales bacterium]